MKKKKYCTFCKSENVEYTYAEQAAELLPMKCKDCGRDFDAWYQYGYKDFVDTKRLLTSGYMWGP